MAVRVVTTKGTLYGGKNLQKYHYIQRESQAPWPHRAPPPHPPPSSSPGGGFFFSEREYRGRRNL